MSRWPLPLLANLKLGNSLTLTGASCCAGVVGRLLQRVVVAVREGVGFRIVDRVMIQVCLERLGGVVPAQVARPRRRSRRVEWHLAGVGGGCVRARRLVFVYLRVSRVTSLGGVD